jgi:hypothetical protein
VSIGAIDIDTVAEGAFANVGLSNEAVMWNFSDTDYFNWTDNFQVGSPDLIPVEKIPGDANNDRVVDKYDAKVLADHWGEGNATWEMGDFNEDYIVNVLDAAILAANWTGSGESSAAVPEPTAVLLMLAGLAAIAPIRRRRA